ncbi:MAG: hypothetical protein IJN92_09460 [Lachnospiraceae bacterium]|nr:hypothetical protein [Lachnospiraceae bacterium]
MERLTTNKNVSEMGMYELAHNCCYIKDSVARYRDFELDIDARELTRKLLIEHAEDDDAFTSDEDFDEWMIDYLQDGMDSLEGLIALFYRNLWAMADLRERLKAYEDAEEQGLLLRLPCKVGDTVWYIDDDDDDYPLKFIITKIDVEENGYLRYHAREKDNCGKIGFIKDDIGKTVFLTKEEAEQALAEMKEV